MIFGAIAGTAPYGVVCLTGVSAGGSKITIDGGSLNRDLVLENDAIVGSVNANTDHYAQAATALAAGDPAWLNRIITRHVPLTRAAEAFEATDDDIKVVIDLGGSV